jgi:hypothetical protein
VVTNLIVTLLNTLRAFKDLLRIGGIEELLTLLQLESALAYLGYLGLGLLFHFLFLLLEKLLQFILRHCRHSGPNARMQRGGDARSLGPQIELGKLVSAHL